MNKYNKAYEDGYVEGLSVNVSCMIPRPGEVVALFYDTEKIDIETLGNSIKKLGKKIPMVNIIALPDSTCLKKCDKKFLEAYIELIKTTINEMENN